jgi:HPt (histidine-containing phosphotransfer) domain-containing protein
MNPANNNARAKSGAAPGAGTIGAGKAVEITTAEGTVSLARIDRLRHLLPGKDSLLDELIDLFVSDLPKRLNAIAQAVERVDAKALALHAHALRGGAANFGASRLDTVCGRLEAIGVAAALAEAPPMLNELGRESAQVRAVLLALKSRPLATPAGASSTARR